MTKIAVTGHRPDKLGGYDAHENFKAIRRHMRRILQDALNDKLVLISGGALGIDQFWMEVGLHLRIPVIAALPFEGYDARWPLESRKRYEKLLDKCSEVLYVCEPGYDPQKLQKRNEYMVNDCDLLAAYSNGAKGGTTNCINYAASLGKGIRQFNTDDIINDSKKPR